MASFNATTDLGLERIAREAAMLLITNINSTLTAIDATWTTLDQELATAQGIDYAVCASDPVSASKIHVGHRPSFIENSAANYPNLCVMAYSSTNSQYRNFDQGEDIGITFYIEGMVKQGPYATSTEFSQEGEILVNKKAQRLVEAVHKVISDNETLNGLIDGFEGAPKISITDCMKRTDRTDSGQYDYYWAMFRSEYSVTRSINIGF
jgi:hypothetical protein